MNALSPDYWFYFIDLKRTVDNRLGEHAASLSCGEPPYAKIDQYLRLLLLQDYSVPKHRAPL